MRWPAASVSGLWAAGVVLWLLSIAGRGAPKPVSQGVVLLALLATAGIAGTWVAGAIRRFRISGSPAHLIAPSLLLAALAVRLVGLDHEVGEHFYLDEGTYSHHAARINAGEILQKDFVYPHLVYYLDAFVLWMAWLFRDGVAAALGGLYGLDDWQSARRLLLRLVPALAGAATVLPVYALGRRLAGPVAGLAGGLLIVFSPLYNDGSHLGICDVPSAFFAALCLAATARLVEREESSWYLLAGAAAGLAAAAKYPAGLVAVAPAAAWLRWRLADRRFDLGLPLAALAAVGTFLGANPGLLAYPERAWSGPRGVLFGAFQYSGEGWFGAVPPSSALWYAGQLGWSFGWPVVVVGLAGLPLLPGAGRRSLLWLAPFPVLYLGLLVSLDVVVARNLYPVLPPLAAFLGAGAVTAVRRVPLEGGRRRSALAAVGVAALLALPVTRTVLQEVGLTRPGTRVVAREWIRQNLPRGVTILREDYTVDLPPGEYDDQRLQGPRFVAALPLEEILRPEIDFVLLSSWAYQRFFTPQANAGPREREMAERYRALFESLPLTARFPPGRTRRGPELQLYRVLPDPVPYRTRRRFGPGELFVPDGGMRTGGDGAVELTRPGQWTLAKGFFEAGAYRLEVGGRSTGPGLVTVRGLGEGTEDRVALEGSGATLRLPVRDKYLLYVSRPPGSRIEELELIRQAGPGDGGPEAALSAPRSPDQSSR